MSFALSENDVDALIERLNALKRGETGHFHFRTSDFSKNEGVADVEFSMIGKMESENMTIE